MKTVALCLGVFGMGLAAAAPGLSLDRTPVKHVPSLLIAAIDAPEGKASGILIGPLAEEVNKKFGPTDSVLIDVTTVRKLAQEGCSLLHVTFHQIGFKPVGESKPRNARAEVELSLCRDGTQPKNTGANAPRS